MKKIQLLSLLALALPASSYASLEIYKVPGPDLSNTIQAQTRVLELGDAPTESGCITWNGSANVYGGTGCTAGGAGFTGGDEQPSSTTRTAGSLGIVDGSDLRIIFDANETSGDSINLDDLRLLLLDPTNGNVIFSADLADPCTAAGGVAGVTTTGGLCTINPTLTGNGKNDALIRLDAVQAAAFDTAVHNWIVGGGSSLANVRIGLLANVSGPTSGGFEGFYVGNRATFDPPVPEPGTLAIVGLGLACTMFARRRWARTELRPFSAA
jgi:hypothetical protein